MSSNSAHFFALIDSEGHRRVPHLILSKSGRYGYAVHPPGKGNRATAADYSEDEKRMVQAVVLHRCGVRAKAEGGPQVGRLNTVGLAKRAIVGYWLCPSRFDWIDGAKLRPVNDKGTSTRV